MLSTLKDKGQRWASKVVLEGVHKGHHGTYCALLWFYHFFYTQTYFGRTHGCWVLLVLRIWNFPRHTSVSQWSGRFLCIIGRDPSVCKSNRLHVDILRLFYIVLRYIPWIPLKWSVILLKSWTSTGCFSNSTGSIVTNYRFSLIIGVSLLKSS